MISLLIDFHVFGRQGGGTPCTPSQTNADPLACADCNFPLGKLTFSNLNFNFPLRKIDICEYLALLDMSFALKETMNSVTLAI